jgi:phytoene dehydrogenase-like protein
MTEVIVVGGGLAGLVAAKHLATEGVDVRLFERDSSVGGRVRTDTVDGFTLDRGFQVLFTSYPAVRSELDLDALRLREFKPGAVLARPGGRTLLSDPLRDPGALLDTALNRDVTLGDKLRILRLRRRLANKSLPAILDSDEGTIEDALREWGFSERFRERFAAPFYGGITLDRSLSSSRLVFEYTFKMLSEGRIAVPAAGMGAIPKQLAEQARAAGASIETDHEVTAVTPTDDGVEVTVDGWTVEGDGAVVATDPREANELTGCSIPTASQSCVTQYVSIPGTVDLNADRRLLLNVEDDQPNQIAPLTDVAPGFSPDDRQLLSATFLGAPERSDEELAATVRETLSAWYPEERFAEMDLLETYRIPFAQFAQPPGFTESRPRVDDPEGPVFLAGEYTEWSSIQGAMVSGRRGARATANVLDR